MSEKTEAPGRHSASATATPFSGIAGIPAGWQAGALVLARANCFEAHWRRKRV
jgi:hypothetical protein